MFVTTRIRTFNPSLHDCGPRAQVEKVCPSNYKFDYLFLKPFCLEQLLMRLTVFQAELIMGHLSQLSLLCLLWDVVENSPILLQNFEYFYIVVNQIEFK